MQKLLLLSIMFMALIIPIRAARFGVLAASVRDGCGAAPVASQREATDGTAEIYEREDSGNSRTS